jgi:hypothetical protein
VSAAPKTELPTVSTAEAIDDHAWFESRPKRRFRARIGDGGLIWIIRRQGDVFLRVAGASPLPATDTDAALAPLWFDGAYPGLLAAKARKRARKASGHRR